MKDELQPRQSGLDANKVSRRRFIRATTVAGGALLAGGVLAACGDSATSTPAAAGATTTSATVGATSPAATTATTTSAGVTTGSVTTVASSTEQINLVWWSHQIGEAGVPDLRQRIAQEYKKVKPNVNVTINFVPGDYNSKLSAALLTAQAPDIFHDNGGVDVDQIRAGLLADCTDLYTDELKKDLLPGTLDQLTYNGKIYGVMEVIDINMLYYRKSLFDSAGITPPATWDDLLAATKKLTTGKVKGLFLGNDGLSVAGDLPYVAGTDYVVDGKIAFNTDRLITAVTKLKQLHDAKVLLLGAPVDWFDPSALNQGLTAIQYGGAWEMPAVKKALGDDFGVMAIPALDANSKPMVRLGNWTGVVNAKSKYAAEAKAFLKWMFYDNAAYEGQETTSSFHLVPRLSVDNNIEGFKSGAGKQALDISTQYGRVVPIGIPAGVKTAYNNAIINIIQKGADPRSELDQAAQKAQTELDKVK